MIFSSVAIRCEIRFSALQSTLLPLSRVQLETLGPRFFKYQSKTLNAKSSADDTTIRPARMARTSVDLITRANREPFKISANHRAILSESLCFFFFSLPLFSLFAPARARVAQPTKGREREREREGSDRQKWTLERVTTEPGARLGSGNDFGAAGGESETSSTRVSFLSLLLRAMSPASCYRDSHRLGMCIDSVMKDDGNPHSGIFIVALGSTPFIGAAITPRARRRKSIRTSIVPEISLCKTRSLG